LQEGLKSNKGMNLLQSSFLGDNLVTLFVCYG